MATYICRIEEGIFLQKFGNAASRDYVEVIEVIEDDKEITPEFLASKVREKELRKELSNEKTIQFNILHPKQKKNES